VIHFALSSLKVRRLRASLTALAVLIGVAMISGTFVFTDTIHAAFRELFTGAAKGADVIVSGRGDIASIASAPASAPASLERQIRALPGVSAVGGQISDVATIVGRDNKILTSTGAPTLALSYTPPPFSGITFVAGAPPKREDEVAVDRGTAVREGYRVGDLVSIVTGEPAHRFTISGIATLGGVTLGGATFAVFPISEARKLYGKENEDDIIYVAGDSGVSPSTLVREIRPLLSPELIVRTAGGQVDADANAISTRLAVLTGGLLAFGFIAVVIGAFVIFNTFSITVTQRIREFALLRAVGATQEQILAAVLVEVVAIGALASVVGVAAGLGAAVLLRALLSVFGLNLPSTTLVLAPRTVIIGLLVGVGVSVLAGLQPALRATRVPPLEALREGTSAGAGGDPRRALRTWVTAALAIAGTIVIVTSSGTAAARVLQSAVGAVLLVVAIVLVSPLAVRPLARLVALPMEHGGRIIGRLARENSVRNPTRTAVSASSLMIGLALVLFVTVYASGLRSSTGRIIRQTFLGDFTIESQDGATPIPGASARVAAAVPGVIAVSSLKTGDARLPGAGEVTAEGIDPNTIGQVYRFQWVAGSSATLTGLGPGDTIVERDTASSAQLHVGDHVVLTTETGLQAPLTVRGIYADRALLRGLALPIVEFEQLFHQQRLQDVFVKLGPGTDRGVAAAALNRALTAFPGVVARSEHQLEDEVVGRVNSILLLFYALLAISVLTALMGIVNTLSLSVHERTRELGLLRAVGMTRRQARLLIRDEAVITAAIGSIVGVALGIFLAWVITRALSSEGVVFSLPWLQVAAVLAMGPVAGAIAAIPPARRAARLDVLEAIAYE
jgi:putative ABC transport system permease protein